MEDGHLDLPSGEWGRGEGTDKQAENWQGAGNSCLGMTPPPAVS